MLLQTNKKLAPKYFLWKLQRFFIVWPLKGERFTSSYKPGESKYFNNNIKWFFSLLTQKISWRLHFWIFHFLSGFCHFLTQKMVRFKKFDFWKFREPKFQKRNRIPKFQLLLDFSIIEICNWAKNHIIWFFLRQRRLHSVFPTLDWGWERNFGIFRGRAHKNYPVQDLNIIWTGAPVQNLSKYCPNTVQILLWLQ